MAGKFEGCIVCIYDTEGVLLTNAKIYKHSSVKQIIEVSNSPALQNDMRCEVLILAVPSPYSYSGVIHTNRIGVTTISLYRGKEKESRSNTRYGLSGRAVISSYIYDNKPYKMHTPIVAELVNISSSGVRLRTGYNTLSIGDRFIFHIKIRNDTKTLLAKVANFSDNEHESSDYGCALWVRATNKTKIITAKNAEQEGMMRKRVVSSGVNTYIQALEKNTGYGKAKYKILEIFERITSADLTLIPERITSADLTVIPDRITSADLTLISKEELCAVAKELSRIVASAVPTVILELVNAIASADEYLERHCVNVGLLNGVFGKWLELPKETVDTLVIVGLLHDCGKASIPQNILISERALTGIEFEVVKMHPILSYNLLAEFPEEVRSAVRGHHEKVNGKGYPDGLGFGHIPYMARITAISDIYDAMTARRSYRNPINPFDVLSCLTSLAGAELDPKLVTVFVEKMKTELTGKPVVVAEDTTGMIDTDGPDDLEHPPVNS